jgi:nitrogen regulatory protein PII
VVPLLEAPLSTPKKILKNHKKIDSVSLLPKMEIEIVVSGPLADETVKVVTQAAGTGEIGDGRVFVMQVDQSYRICTGELEHG